MLNIIQNTIGAIRRVGESVVRAGLKMWLPFTKAEPLGENLVVNGDFSDGNSGWYKSAGWSINNGKANRSGVSTNSYIQHSISLVEGKRYKISYERTYESGFGTTNLFSLFTNTSTRSTLGSYTSTVQETVTVTDYFTAGHSSDIELRVYGIQDFTGSIDNVVIQEYAQETPDISGNDNNAILKTGKALVFAGNDSVETSFPSSKTIKTIAFWIYPTHSASFEALFNLGITNIPVSPLGDRVIELNHLTIRNRQHYPLNFDVYIDGVYRGETNWNGDNPTLKINQWQRVVFVNSNGTSTVNDTFDVAYTGSGSHGRFKMSDLQIYGADWSTDDISYDYANPQKLVTDNASSNVTLNDLHAWWHMSEGDGTIAFDSAPLIGDELVVNGDFSDGKNNWNFESKWSLSNGGARLQSNDSSGSALVQYSVFEVGKTYKITFDADVSFGVAKFYGGTGDSLITISETKNYSLTFVADFTNLVFQRVSNSSDLTIDNVSVKEVYNIDGKTYDGSSLGASYVDAQERIPQLGMMNWSKGSNLLTYSEDLTEWTLAPNSTLTYENDVVAPDGTIGVYRLLLPAQNGTNIKSPTYAAGTGRVFSMWVKKTDNNNSQFNFYDGSQSSTTFTATNEWQRFEMTGQAGTNSYVLNTGDTFITDIYIWGGQVESSTGMSVITASAYRRTDGTAVTDATLISSATNSQKDILGNAVRVKGSGFNLDGTGYAEILDDSAFDIPACNSVDEGGFTLEAWVKAKYVNKDSTINVVATLGGDITQSATGGICVFSNKIGAYVNTALLEADNNFIQGNWYHVVITRSDSGICKLYIDTNAQSDTDYKLSSVTNSNNKMVGRDSLPYQRFYEELIDDVKFYNRELSSDEIEQNYNATKSGHNN